MNADTERPFEEIYRELEETVRRLETGELTLAESLALFERGSLLAERCNTMLDQAELRVRKLIGDSAGEMAIDEADSYTA